MRTLHRPLLLRLRRLLRTRPPEGFPPPCPRIPGRVPFPLPTAQRLVHPPLQRAPARQSALRPQPPLRAAQRRSECRSQAKPPAPPPASRLPALVGQASACQHPLAAAFLHRYPSPRPAPRRLLVPPPPLPPPLSRRPHPAFSGWRLRGRGPLRRLLPPSRRRLPAARGMRDRRRYSPARPRQIGRASCRERV